MALRADLSMNLEEGKALNPYEQSPDHLASIVLSVNKPSLREGRMILYTCTLDIRIIISQDKCPFQGRPGDSAIDAPHWLFQKPSLEYFD
jgi:hypothetical protein